MQRGVRARVPNSLHTFPPGSFGTEVASNERYRAARAKTLTETNPRESVTRQSQSRMLPNRGEPFAGFVLLR